MSGPLQLIPPGLLSLFAIKSSGRNPTDLGDQLWPTLEMRDWYLAALWLPQTVQIADVNVRGFTGPSVVVPQNQAWYIRFLTGTTDGALVGAGNAVKFQLANSLTGGTEKFMGSVVSLVAADSGAVSYEPVWLARPGTSIGIFLHTLTHAVANPMRLNFESVVLQL